MCGGKALVNAAGMAAIGAAAITATGGIIAAVIATHHQSADGNAGLTTTTSSSTVQITGVVRPVGSSPGAWVYRAPVQDPTTNRIGPVSAGQHVRIVCTQQGPLVDLAVDGGVGRSTLWDKIIYNENYAFIPDISVERASGQPDPPTC
jgi:hypothetical protein